MKPKFEIIKNHTSKCMIDKEQETMELYLVHGLGCGEISRKFGCSSAYIFKWLKANYVSIRTPKEGISLFRKLNESPLTIKMDENDILDIVNMYGSKFGLASIAKKYNKSVSTIRRILVENSIKIRSCREANEIKSDVYFETYGIRNPMQNPEIFDKAQRSGKLYKSTIIDGIEIKYQGYELKCILKLLDEGYSINDISIGKGQVPSFKYNFNEKDRRYYPDIYIKKDNRIVEVKSRWTYEKEFDKNQAKRKAVECKGYKFDFYILDR